MSKTRLPRTKPNNVTCHIYSEKLINPACLISVITPVPVAICRRAMSDLPQEISRRYCRMHGLPHPIRDQNTAIKIFVHLRMYTVSNFRFLYLGHI